MCHLEEISLRSNPNSRSVNLLQPLFPYSVAPVLCFQQLAASYPKTPGVGYPERIYGTPRVGVPLPDGRCTVAQKCPSVSPLPATLTHSVSRKSFPCHSYANTRDRGVTAPPKSSSPLATRHSPLPLTPFRINTCKSVSKQRTLTTFRMNTYAKQGEGGPYSEGPSGRKYWVPFTGSCRRRSNCCRSALRSTKSMSEVLMTRRSEAA